MSNAWHLFAPGLQVGRFCIVDLNPKLHHSVSVNFAVLTACLDSPLQMCEGSFEPDETDYERVSMM